MHAKLRVPFEWMKRFRKSQTGQAQVEFVLSVLFVIIVVVSIVEMVFFMYTYTVLADAAKEGVRYAIVHGCDLSAGTCSGTCSPACTDTTGSKVGDYAKIYLGASLHDVSAMTVSVTYPSGNSQPLSPVRVEISYPYQPFFGMGWPTVTVRAAAEGRIFY